ncbi:MAG: hypothetical protein INQ03_24100 [Candidatus Heimdallarchaeota archaeon]|nr:hypothetical protein [Candidatus Heimdallarchaeota archaeon]
MRYREAQVEDIPDIISLWKIYFSNSELSNNYEITKSEEKNYNKELRDHIRNPRGIVLIAEKDDLRGYTFAHIKNRGPVFPDRFYGYLVDIVIHPDYVFRFFI